MTIPRLFLEPLGAPARLRLSGILAEAKGGDALAPVTVVVPGPYAGLSLRRSLAAVGGLLNVRFMVLPRLAEMIGSPLLAANGKSPLTPLIELAAIRSVSGRIAAVGFPADTSHPRLHLSLRRAFSHLDRLSVEELEALARTDPLRARMVEWRGPPPRGSRTGWPPGRCGTWGSSYYTWFATCLQARWPFSRL